jgi:hypothetical protein
MQTNEDKRLELFETRAYLTDALSICRDAQISHYINMGIARIDMLLRRYERRGNFDADTHPKAKRS